VNIRCFWVEYWWGGNHDGRVISHGLYQLSGRPSVTTTFRMWTSVQGQMTSTRRSGGRDAPSHACAHLYCVSWMEECDVQGDHGAIGLRHHR
jgi:hypothetical protein